VEFCVYDRYPGARVDSHSIARVFTTGVGDVPASAPVAVTSTSTTVVAIVRP
jgi:hypothetical protein